MKTKIFSLLMLCFFITTYAQKKEIRNAERAADDGDFSEAKSLLKEVENTFKQEKEKWQSKYWLTKGKAFLAEGLGTSFEDLKTAAESYQKAIELGEDVDEAKTGIAEVRAALVNNAVEDQKKSKNMLASDKLYEAYRLGKKDTLYLYYAAESAISAQEYDQALVYYHELLDLNYDGSQMLYQATNAETNTVETFGSEILRDASIKSGTHKEPKDVQSPSKTGSIAKNVAFIYIEQDKPEKAIESMERAKAENPGDVDLMQEEANLYYNMGDIKKYNEIMSEVAQQNPNDPVVFYNLGVSAERLDDYDKAQEYYKKAIELDPEMADPYTNIASMIAEKAEKITEEMNKLSMSAADTKKYDKLKAEKVEVYKEAIPYLKKTIELNPSNVNAIKYLRSVYYQTQEEDKIEELNKLLEKMENNE